MLIVRSPVRISFAGGGTDLPAFFHQERGAVLSTTINKYCYAILTRRDDGRIHLISADLRSNHAWHPLRDGHAGHDDLQLPMAALKQAIQPLSVNLFLASEIPPGTGLGSSAAVCVGVLKAIATYAHLPWSRYEIAERAYFVARQELHKPVGKQDEYAAVFGGLNTIEFFPGGEVKVTPLPLAHDLLEALQSRLLLFDTGQAHNSWEILNQQERDSAPLHSHSRQVLRQGMGLADAMRQALIAADLTGFGQLLHQAWLYKKQVSLQISNAVIDELYAGARRQGAVGWKITGAGGGGFLLLYCEPEQQPQLREYMRDRNLQEMSFQFETGGAAVVVNDPYLDADANCGLRWEFLPEPAAA